MAYGIQLLTSDGEKTTLDFKAGRFLAISEELNVKSDRNHTPPAVVDLSDPDTFVFPAADLTFYFSFTTEVNRARNRIEIRLRPHASFSEEAPGMSIQFMFIKFQ